MLKYNPILYYSPKITNQIYQMLNDSIITSKTVTKKTTMASSIKTLIESLFLPFSLKGEVKVSGEMSKENTINISFDELSRTIEIINKLQKEIFKNDLSNIEELPNTLFFISGEFDVKLKRSITDNKNVVEMEFASDNYIVRGTTSIDNWISKSLINQILINGKLNASALIIPLYINNNIIDAQFACIFIIKEN